MNIMNISEILLFICATSIFASIEEKVSIQLENKPIDEVFSAIKTQTSYSFWFDVKDVDIKRLVSLDVNNEAVAIVLSKALKDQDVEFSIYGNHIIIAKKGTLKSKTESQQGVVVTGIVRDNNEPVIGVNVIIKGTTNGTITDANGK
jgi:hypothetical protein